MRYYKTRNCPKCNKGLIYSYSSSYCLARKRNAQCRNCATLNRANRQNDLSPLLKEENISYYWTGFILSDGHISNSTRLSVTLSKKDKEHLIKLKRFLNIYTLRENSQVSISGMDSKIVRSFCSKFDIKSNKTYNPPKLSIFKNIKEELLLSLFCGFIDGDGNIGNLHNRLDFHLRIKLHSSWLKILKLFSIKFLDNCTVKLNNQGYAQLVCSNTEAIKNLKQRILNLNVPYLDRKWNIVNLNYISRYKVAQNRLRVVKELVNTGKSLKEISSIVNIGIPGISLMLKRNKIKYEKHKPGRKSAA